MTMEKRQNLNEEKPITNLQNHFCSSLCSAAVLSFVIRWQIMIVFNMGESTENHSDNSFS